MRRSERSDVMKHQKEGRDGRCPQGLTTEKLDGNDS